MRWVCAVVIGAYVLATPLRAAEPIVTGDLLRIQRVTSIDVSRTGDLAVAAVHSIETKPPAADEHNGEHEDSRPLQPTYHQRSHLYLFDLTDPDAQPQQLTFGERYDTGPQISPDGRRIAFIRRPEASAASPQENNAAQLWIIRTDGGEAQQRTELEHGASNPIWSPDGSAILISSTIPISEMNGAPPWSWDRPGRVFGDADGDHPDADPAGDRRQIRNWLAGNAAEVDPIVIHRLHFQGEQSLHEAHEFTHLFLVSSTDFESQPRRITGAFADHNDPAFLPDGQHIVYSRKTETGEHPDRVLQSEIRRIDISGTDDELLLAMDGWRLASPQPSRDGTLLAYIGRQIDQPAYRIDQLGIASLSRSGVGESVWLTEPQRFDAEAFDIRWMSSRPALLFRTAMRGGFPLMMASPSLLEPAPFIAGDEGEFPGIHSYDVGGGIVVYSLTEPRNPCVLRVRDVNGNDRLLMDLNPWVAQKRLTIPQERWLERPDGTRIQYWLMEPINRQSGQTYPLALEIHGGPMVMWGPGEFTMWHEFQLLCSWGYGVVYANPRGSSGYGYAFQRANEQNWGDGPAGDCLAAVDAALLEPWVDPDRLVVTGGSYAGYLTAWIVGHDHRFKAAVAQRGVYDLDTFFGEGNAWQLVPWCFGGYPWEPQIKAVLQRESPFTYVNRIRTPLLIMHASSDLRTGVSQSEMLFRALAVQGKPVEYVRYPDAGHDLSRTGDPRQRLDRLNRIIEFFERFIDNPRSAPAP